MVFIFRGCSRVRNETNASVKHMVRTLATRGCLFFVDDGHASTHDGASITYDEGMLFKILLDAHGSCPLFLQDSRL
jgi:hypothetical protein